MATNPWDKHVGTANNGFASNQDYANAIIAKEASGQTLSDPGAAAAFKAANPGYFSTPSGGSGSSSVVSPSPNNTVTSNIQYFGSPEAYAQKIIGKEAAGIPLSDPTSAATFKQQNPHLFPGEQKKNILQQLQQVQQQPVSVEQLPEYGAMQNLAKQRGDIGSRQAMETLNQRGILNSTITADNVAQIQQQAQTEILPVLLERAYGLRKEQAQQLMQLLEYYSKEEQNQFTQQQKRAEAENERLKIQIAQKEKNIKAALDRIDTLGYADNFAAQILGVSVGTLSAKAKQAAQDRQDKLDQQRRDYGLDIMKYEQEERKNITNNQKDAANSLKTAKESAYKYFDSIEEGNKYSKTKITPGVASNLKKFYEVELKDLLTTPDPMATLNGAEGAIRQEYKPWTANHLINALRTTLGQYNPKQ